MKASSVSETMHRKWNGCIHPEYLMMPKIKYIIQDKITQFSFKEIYHISKSSSWKIPLSFDQSQYSKPEEIEIH